MIAALAQKQDLDEVFRHHLEIAINQLLQTELAEFLGYERYSYAGINTGNNRNGSYERSFDTKYGQLNLTIPRDRNGRFENHTLPAYGRHSDNLETTVIQLYTKGITTAEIAELIEKMYGAHYSKATVSNMTKAVNEQVQAFQQRRLASQYAAIFLDATYLPLKRDTVQKEAVHIAIGIRPDGTKDVLLFVADGLVGLDEGLNRHFPKAKRQRCLVHVGRDLMNKVRVKDRKAVISDFKQVHRAANREAAELKLNEFANNWHQTYPKLIKDLLKMPNLLTFMDFPPAIRQSLYSTNLIENFNKHLKRTTHHKEQFPTEDSLDRFLVSQFNVYNEKSLKRIHRGFKGLQDTLEASFI
ncbi:IS256 family transposase [Lactiplantibacillus pentosus]|uniref:IS256 family transposase n=1 Tax=Lactiplantibacillus pentosus TaxID=1589 RepID=UPI003C6CB5FC